MGVYIEIALRNLLQARSRSLLLGVALGGVTFLLVLLLSLSQGLSETMIHSATTFATGHVNVAGFFKAKANDAAPILSQASPVRAIVEENTPGLDYVIDRHRGWGRLVAETASLFSSLVGIDPAQEKRLFEVVQLAPESSYRDGGSEAPKGDLSKLAEPNQILIFAGQAKRLGIGVGDPLTIAIETYTGARNTIEVTVAAVAKDIGFMSNWNVFVSKQTILDLYRLSPETTGAVMVYLKDVTQSEAVMEQLRGVFEQKGFRLMNHDPQPFWMKFETVAGEDWSGQKLDLTVWKDEVSFLTWVLTAVDTVSFFLVGVLLVIIVIGIMNSMWISVRERTQEVGTLRAIGMQRSRVLLMFLVEALLLGFAATTIGALVGALFAVLIDALALPIPWEAVRAVMMSDVLHLSVRPEALLAAVTVFTVVTAISALWPALRAARMAPVTAINKVG